jgi:threonine aldolase
MRQVGIIAAAALYALDHHIDRLAQDHEHAKGLAAAVRPFDFLKVMGSEPETNILIFHVSEAWGTAHEFASALERHGVQAMAFSPTAIRMVTHLDITGLQIQQVCKVIERIGNSPKNDK